jgi:hypothetical protein
LFLTFTYSNCASANLERFASFLAIFSFIVEQNRKTRVKHTYIKSREIPYSSLIPEKRIGSKSEIVKRIFFSCTTLSYAPVNNERKKNGRVITLFLSLRTEPYGLEGKKDSYEFYKAESSFLFFYLSFRKKLSAVLLQLCYALLQYRYAFKKRVHSIGNIFIL